MRNAREPIAIQQFACRGKIAFCRSWVLSGGTPPSRFISLDYTNRNNNLLQNSMRWSEYISFSGLFTDWSLRNAACADWRWRQTGSKQSFVWRRVAAIFLSGIIRQVVNIFNSKYSFHIPELTIWFSTHLLFSICCWTNLGSLKKW